MKNKDYDKKEIQQKKKKKILSAILAVLMLLGVLAPTIGMITTFAEADLPAPIIQFLYTDSNGDEYLSLANSESFLMDKMSYETFLISAQIDWEEDGNWASDSNEWDEGYPYQITTYNLGDSYGSVKIKDSNGHVFHDGQDLPETIRIRYLIKATKSDGWSGTIKTNWSSAVNLGELTQVGFSDGAIDNPVLFDLKTTDYKNYLVKCQNDGIMSIWYGLPNVTLVQYFEIKRANDDWTSLASMIVTSKNQEYILKLSDAQSEDEPVLFRSRYGVYNTLSNEKRTSEWSESISISGEKLDSGEYRDSGSEAVFEESTQEESAEENLTASSNQDKRNNSLIIFVTVAACLILVFWTITNAFIWP